MSVHTIGHSTRTIQRFLELLADAGIDHVVDVRRWPVSRRHPHFTADRLGASLRAAGVAYQHSEALGGHRDPLDESPNAALRSHAFRGYADHMQTAEFQQALNQLLLQAGQQRLAIMCAEADPASCHRSLLADALMARGVTAHHILEREIMPHAPTRHAVFREGSVFYPGGRADREPSPLHELP